MNIKYTVIFYIHSGFIKFSDGFTLETDEMEKMQDRAHRYCFIANSLSEEVDVQIL